MTDTEQASGAGYAYGADTIINQGQQTLFRTSMGGYARIRNSTQLWSEEDETMPGIIRYDMMTPFLPTAPLVAYVQPIKITGGRDFILDLIVYDDLGEIVDITDAIFIAQIRRYRYAKNSMVQMSYEILDGPTGSLRLRLTPDQTGFLVRWMMRGVWDLEMQLDGVESTVIVESLVRVTPGISQGTMIGAGSGEGTGEGNNNA